MTLEAIAAALNARVPQINQDLSAHILSQHGDPLETSMGERKKELTDLLGVSYVNSDLAYNLSHLCGMSSLMINSIVVRGEEKGPEGTSYIRVTLDVAIPKDLTAQVTGNFTADLDGVSKSVDFTGDAKITDAKHSYPAVFRVKITGEELNIVNFQMGSTMSSTPLKLGSATARLSDMGVFEVIHHGFEIIMARYMNEKLGNVIIDSVLRMLQTVISAEISK